MLFWFFKAEVESTKEEMAKHVEEAELNKATLRKELDLVQYHLHLVNLACLLSSLILTYASYKEMEKTEFYMNNL